MKLTMAPRQAAIAVAATYQMWPISTKKIRQLKSTMVAIKEAIWERRKETINGKCGTRFIPFKAEHPLRRDLWLRLRLLRWGIFHCYFCRQQNLFRVDGRLWRWT